MDTAYQMQEVDSVERLGADVGNEHRSSGLGQQQRQSQEMQDGEPRPPGAAAAAPIANDAASNRCQADGCMADLSGLRRYFRRYHVCETHIRSQVVLIGGRQVRFCDQCSTFHALSLFDGTRRTCREKLEQNRLKRRARKQQTAGNPGGQQASGVAAALAAAAAGAAGGGGTQHSDDADSDDQPPNGATGTDGDDAGPLSPACKGHSFAAGRRGKRPGGVPSQGARRQLPAPRQSAGPDVTRAVGAFRASAGHVGRTVSPSPDPDDEEPDRRNEGPGAGGCGFRDEAAWGAAGLSAELPGAGLALGGAFGGGDGWDAGYANRTGASRHGDLDGMPVEWPRHDLRDQEHLQTAFAVRGMPGCSPRGPQQQQQQRGPPGAHVQWMQAGKAQQAVPLLLLPQHQQQLPPNNWELAAGGMMALEGMPAPAAVQGPRRQHGGSMPNLPQEPPASPPPWSAAGEPRATWHAVPAVAGISAGTPLDGPPAPQDMSLRDGVLGFAAAPPGGGAPQQLLQLQQAGPNGTGSTVAAGPALNGLRISGVGREGADGPLGRTQDRLPVGALAPDSDGAPAVTLLKHFLRTEADLYRPPPPRPSQAPTEALSPVQPLKLAQGSVADQSQDPDALGPAKTALQLKLDSGLLKPQPQNALTSLQPQPSLGAGLQRPWVPSKQRDLQQEQELQGQRVAASLGLVGQADYGGMGAAGGQHDVVAWMANRAASQAGAWAAASVSQLGAAPHGFRAGPAPRPFASMPSPSIENRPQSPGSSIYTADEEGAPGSGYEEPEVDTAAVLARARAAAEGKVVLGQPPNLEVCPSLLQKASFQLDLQTAMMDTQRWEQQHQQMHIGQWNHHQQEQQQQQQRVQFVLSIRQPQLQAGYADMPQQQVRPAVTLLDHIQQQQQQQLGDQQRQHEHGLHHNSNNSVSCLQPQHPQQLPQQQQQLHVQAHTSQQQQRQQEPLNTFDKLYEARQRRTARNDSHIHLSAFHMQGPMDLDLESDCLQPVSGQWRPQPGPHHGNTKGSRAMAANGTTLGGGGWPAHQNAPTAGGTPSPSPSPPLLEPWAGAGVAPAGATADLRAAGGNGALASGFGAQPRPPSPLSRDDHMGQHHMMKQHQGQQHPLGGGGLGCGPSSLDPSDQELIRTALMNLAAQAPPGMVGTGHLRGTMGPPAAPLPPSVEGRDRGYDAVSAGGGGGAYTGTGRGQAAPAAVWGAGGRSAEGAMERRLTQQQIRPEALQYGDMGSKGPGGDQPMGMVAQQGDAGDSEVLRQMSSVAISEVLLESARTSLLDVDSELFAQVQQELRNAVTCDAGGHGNRNAGPAAGLANGEAPLHGGPPTPQPPGGEGGFVGGHGGGVGIGNGRLVIAEGEGWGRSSYDSHALAGPWQQQQQPPQLVPPLQQQQPPQLAPPQQQQQPPQLAPPPQQQQSPQLAPPPQQQQPPQLAPPQHQQLRGGGGRVYANGEERSLHQGGGAGLRAWSQQQLLQHQQQRQERASAPQAALQAQLDYHYQGNHHQQQQHTYHQQHFGQQQWNQQHRQQHHQQHGDDRGVGSRGLSHYGLPYDPNGGRRDPASTGDGAGGGGGPGGSSMMSHLALKLSHARAEDLPADLVERMQEAVRGGGAALLPATLREGCVEVLVELLHSCPASELCSSLFQLPAATAGGGAGSSVCRPGNGPEAAAADADAAAVAASEQLRAWVGPELFDACERVTMQLMRGPVLDCRPGTRPKLRTWEQAMQQAGLAFAAQWPELLMLHSGPPVVVADSSEPQQVQVYAPSELKSRLGLVQLCIRMAGDPCSLGSVEAEAVAVPAAVPVGNISATRAPVAQTAGTDGEDWQGPSTAAGTTVVRALRVLTAPDSGMVDELEVGPLTLASGVAPSEGHSHSFAYLAVREGLAEVIGEPAWPRSLQQQQLHRGEHSPNCLKAGAGLGKCALVGPTSPVACETVRPEVSSAEPREQRPGPSAYDGVAGSPSFPSSLVGEAEDAGEEAASAPCGTGLRARGAAAHGGGERILSAGTGAGLSELLRSCFLVAAPLLSLPTSPIAAQQQQQQQTASSQEHKLQPLEHSKLHFRGRFKSADGVVSALQGIAGGCHPVGASSPSPGAASAPPPLKCKSLNRQTSARRDAAHTVAASANGLGGHGRLEAPSQRLSVCSSAALTTTLTLHDRLSCHSSATASTTATTLYDRRSLRSDWSVASNLTSFGGGMVAGSAGGERPPCAGSSTRIAELPATGAGSLSACSDRTLGSNWGLSSGTETAGGSSRTSTTSACTAAASGGPSPEGGSPRGPATGEAVRAMLSPPAAQQQLPAEAAEAAGGGGNAVRGHQQAARRALSLAWPQLAVAAEVAAAGFRADRWSEPEHAPEFDLDAGTPRLVAAPAGLQVPFSPSPRRDDDGGLQVSGPSGGRVLAGIKSGLQPLRLALPVLPRAGLALLEALGGHAVAGCWPLLVVETAAQRNDLALLWRDLGQQGRQGDAWCSLAAELGLVLGHLPRGVRACDPSVPADAAADAQPSSTRGSRPLTVAAAAAAAERGYLGAVSGSDSVLSAESAYPESWGTDATLPPGSEQLGVLPSLPSPPQGTAAVAAVAAAQQHKLGGNAGSGSSSVCAASRASGGVLPSAAAAVACSSVLTACAPSRASDLSMDAAAIHGGRAVAVSAAAAALGEDKENGQGGAQKERVRSLQRGNKLSMTSGLVAFDGGGDGGEEDPRVSAVTSFLAGMRIAAGAGGADLGTDAADAPDSSAGGGDQKAAVQAAAATLPTRAVSPPRAILNAAAAEARAPLPQASSIPAMPCLLPPPSPQHQRKQQVPPAAAVGLSADARAVLQAAVSRLRSIVDKRRMPALWEVLTRVEVEDVQECGEQPVQAPKAPAMVA